MGGDAFFLLAMYVAYYSSMGTMLIPYEALGAELTPDHADRSNLFAMYFVFTVAGILVAVLAPSMVSNEKTGYFMLALIFGVLFVSASWSVAIKLKESATTEENPPAVPSMVNCLRNPVFRVLLLNQLIEAIGGATQFTVISFVVGYVIDPEYDSDGTKRLEDDPNYWSEGTVFTMLGGASLCRRDPPHARASRTSSPEISQRRLM